MSASSQKVAEPIPIAWIPSRWRGLYLQARSRRIEREHREEFRRFYASLPQKKDILYMFFTSGLLHWVSRALSFVPENVNIVLVGSDLQEGELTWIQENVRRPFHHIRLRVDDRAVWEFLFETSVNNFGWLDIDCFIFEPRLFQEIVQIDPGVVANTVWSFQAPGGTDMLCTFFVFLNVEAIRAIAAEIAVSPNIYTYEPIRRPASPYAFSSLLTPRHVELLSRVLPCSNGRPSFASGDGFFDTLQVFQLIAVSKGFQLHRVRPLSLEQQLASEEIMHIGKVSYYQRFKTRPEPALRRIYMLLLQADFVLLSELEGQLPVQYLRRKEAMAAELVESGLRTNLDQIKEVICGEMVKMGAAESSISKVVRRSHEYPSKLRVNP